MNKRPFILAFYLPQYFPFKENDEWWGKGFTEWTSVGRAKPLFKGHYQPKVPADLSYYDLRVPETREAQAALAREYGIDGFCYWHYWFGNGKRLMCRVEDEVTASGKPDFPYCYCWANHTWFAKNWNVKDAKKGHRIVIEQQYPGKEDYIAHFNLCLSAFKDHRYIKEGNKPVFAIYDAASIPDLDVFIKTWNELARANGFDGIYFISYNMNVGKYEKVKDAPFDAFVVDPMNKAEKPVGSLGKLWRRVLSHFDMEALMTLRLIKYSDYAKAVVKYFEDNPQAGICVLPNYDHSPRSGKNAIILTDSTPDAFGRLLLSIKSLLDKRESNNKYLFIKAWNEWGEGNYLEPDLIYGRGYLEQVKNVFGVKK